MTSAPLFGFLRRPVWLPRQRVLHYRTGLLPLRRPVHGEFVIERPCSSDPAPLPRVQCRASSSPMKNAIVLLVHLLAGVAILLGTGGTRAVLAENILLRQQLLVLQRSRRRAPNLRTADRWLFGFCAQFVSLRRLIRTAIILKPATPLRFHRGFKDFSNIDSSTPPVRRRHQVCAS